MAATCMRNPSSSQAENWIEKYQRLQLDEERKSLTLLSILRSFDGPINEERAWAILYQAAKAALHCFVSSANGRGATLQYPSCEHFSDNKVLPTDSGQNGRLSSISAGKTSSNLSRTYSHEPSSDTGHCLPNSKNEAFCCCVVSEASHLWIHHEGHVHPLSFMVPLHLVKGIWVVK